jgi:hypothetical protein
MTSLSAIATGWANSSGAPFFCFEILDPAFQLILGRDGVFSPCYLLGVDDFHLLHLDQRLLQGLDLAVLFLNLRFQLTHPVAQGDDFGIALKQLFIAFGEVLLEEFEAVAMARNFRRLLGHAHAYVTQAQFQFLCHHGVLGAHAVAVSLKFDHGGGHVALGVAGAQAKGQLPSNSPADEPQQGGYGKAQDEQHKGLGLRHGSPRKNTKSNSAHGFSAERGQRRMKN